MVRGGIDLDYVLRLGKVDGKITEARIALWTGRLGQSVYMAFRQLAMMCEEGLLNDDKVMCHYDEVKREIRFAPVTRDAESWEEVEEELKAIAKGEYKVVEE